MANFNSYSLLPTPENTILFGFIPAFKAFSNSPDETTSAPEPNFPKNLKIKILELDFTEKHIKGLIFLKFFTKFK